MQILSVFPDITNIANFRTQGVHKIRNKNYPHIFLKLFGVLYHAYPNFSLTNFSLPRTLLKTIRFAISGLILWNNCLSKTDKKKDKLITF